MQRVTFHGHVCPILDATASMSWLMNVRIHLISSHCISSHLQAEPRMARSTVVSEGGKSVVDDYRSSDGTFLDVGLVRCSRGTGNCSMVFHAAFLVTRATPLFLGRSGLRGSYCIPLKHVVSEEALLRCSREQGQVMLRFVLRSMAWWVSA